MTKPLCCSCTCKHYVPYKHACIMLLWADHDNVAMHMTDRQAAAHPKKIARRPLRLVKILQHTHQGHIQETKIGSQKQFAQVASSC